MKIDLVYLWCDGSDPKWLKKKEYWQQKYGLVNAEAVYSCRFIQHDELKFSLRSVEMYMPWINHIFIVSDEQVPEWLDTDNPKISIVDHRDIIPEDALPTFNSNAIEACLCNIPGLSEHFLYANDDMMVARPLTPDYFFAPDGRPYVFLRNSNLSTPCVYTDQVLLAQNLIKEKYGTYYPFLPHHNIDAYRLSDVRRCLQTFPELTTKTVRQRFRERETLQRSLWGYYALATGNGILVHNRNIDPRLSLVKKINLTMSNRRQKISETVMRPAMLSSTLCRTNPGLFCINDNEYLFSEERYQIKWELAHILPFPSVFEKQIRKKWKYKVSVIVPVYNAGRYLKRCLDSLLAQSLADMEIVCVNDGSDDNSSEILNNYAATDARVKVLSFEKIGPGGCRNAGIDAAEGKYIAFVDADDYVERETFLTAYEKIEESAAEILSFNALEIQTDGIKKNIFFSADREKEVSGGELLPSFFKNRLCCWHLLINHDFLLHNHFYFSANRYYGEEMMFMLPLFAAAQKVKLIPNLFYRYCRNRTSLIATAASGRLQLLKTIPEIMRFLRQKESFACMEKEFRRWCVKFSCFAYNDMSDNRKNQQILCKGLKKVLDKKTYRKFRKSAATGWKMALFGISFARVVYFNNTYTLKLFGIPLFVYKKG